MRISDWSSDVCSSDLISVTANVAPRLMHEMCMAALAGNAVLTRTLNARLATLNKVLFVEANPIPVKWAVAQMGLSKLGRSEEHTSELQSLMRISYAVFCLKKQSQNNQLIT